MDVASYKQAVSARVVDADERAPEVPTLAERALVEAAREGDRSAWELLYRRLYPRFTPTTPAGWVPSMPKTR